MTLFYPMFAMFLLSLIVLGIMFRSRVRAVMSKEVSLGYFRTYPNSQLPDSMIKPARHFTNLFEAPILFYVACVTAMILNFTGPVILMAAWSYVLFRYIHAFIHIGNNDVIWRMRVYALSWVALCVLWFGIFFGTLNL